MPWFKVDDKLAVHPKAVQAGNKALGLWVRAGSWSMAHLTDGFVPDGMIAVLGGGVADARQLVKVGLWESAEGGWQFRDWMDYQPSSDDIKTDREKSARRVKLSRDPNLRQALRDRDGDNCRYCGVEVKWSDRKGALGATYDHIDPFGPDTFDNLVIACRGCNSRKGQRTPQQAGMVLTQVVSRYDLDINQAPVPIPVPIPMTDSGYLDKSSPVSSARDVDSTSIHALKQDVIAAFDSIGVDKPFEVRERFEQVLGVELALTDTVALAEWILRKANGEVRNVDGYLRKVCLADPGTVAEGYRLMDLAVTA